MHYFYLYQKVRVSVCVCVCVCAHARAWGCVCMCICVFISFHRKGFSWLNKTINVMPEVHVRGGTFLCVSSTFVST